MGKQAFVVPGQRQTQTPFQYSLKRGLFCSFQLKLDMGLLCPAQRQLEKLVVVFML